MKTLLAFLLCLLTLAAHAQESWPRNPKTGKVEFTGVLPWPATAKTEAQRQALVRRWYLARLTDSSPAEVAADVKTMVSASLLTYAGLPNIAVMQFGSGDTARFLAYNVMINSGKMAAKVRLSAFEMSQADQNGTPLEHHLATPVANEQAALAALRKRLAKALAGWN